MTRFDIFASSHLNSLLNFENKIHAKEFYKFYLIFANVIDIASTIFLIGLVILIIIGLFRRNARLTKKYKPSRVVAVLTVHNEEDSIGILIDSCKSAKFGSIYVIADQCTDRTVEAAEGRGVAVIPVSKKSKSLALKEALPAIISREGEEAFYMFFDAGNAFQSTIVDELMPYIESYPVLQVRTRNLNNDSWVSRMYVIMSGFYFRVQNALMNLGMSTILAGFGWGAYGWVLKKYPLQCKSIVDDFEYTLIVNMSVAYIPTISVYDEKTDSFKISFRQRLRWYRGYFFELFMDFNHFRNKPYLIFIPLSLLFWLISILGVSRSFNLNFLIYSILFNSLIYLAALDAQDLRNLKYYDLLIFYFFNLTNILVILYAVFTFKDVSWYRTPHKGIVLSKRKV
ncbi:MAG: glycosyltransferase [Caldisericaceae bacterium]